MGIVSTAQDSERDLNDAERETMPLCGTAWVRSGTSQLESTREPAGLRLDEATRPGTRHRSSEW